ncbi:hypothetical protein FB451DRAFT_1568425 [Mycena latifolia]|nr:hypothetical protein FB451DRAFT_1568425 [Mycena latifolia]
MTDYQIAAPSMYGPGGQDTLFDPIVFGFHLPPAESPRTSGITLILTCLFLMPLVPFHRTMALTDSNSLNTISVLLTTAWTSILASSNTLTVASVPPSPSVSLPHLPPIPASSTISPTPEPVTAQVDQVSATGSKQRKSRDDVDPASVIHTTRARKMPKHADA